MIQFSKTDTGFIASFSDNELYLPNGTISLPSNALSLTIDKADIATFKKSSNGDVLFSGLIGNITFDGDSVTKQTIGEKFSETCLSPIGGGSSDLEERVEEDERVTSEALTALRKIILDNERTTSEALTALKKMISDTNDLVDGIDDRLTDAEAEITTLDTVMSAAVNQLS